ncbi:heavy-metal-associated domain-containing protein [Propioniciclava tarda]|uniref:Heavy-metal-associated domain-containing protein n=1 Tax=Propioniciclava tarda TaxID=433330 RepID=A0A4Q9KL22_PROTD|nr:heavy metal-associated domain-containing protein [Propioniciclava tarda]TBT95064.1 heavy-metal-associated domain-containing protein [Propioniciclava tarda]SMO55009.1 Copper chaperone CopZ [Propioniciclava tarda]HQA31547.1 heavy metal-associated domain-containing protein [Propioniciclava tarda]HQD60201.1 heavy metal-associated domain-containing protein [Propioniciclava tarda]
MMRKVTFTVTGMHCAACGLLIDDFLLDVEGVASACTDLRTARTIVHADADVTDADLIAAIAEAGYQATHIC